jgi:hypothetical protein
MSSMHLLLRQCLDAPFPFEKASKESSLHDLSREFKFWLRSD